jgi:ParB/RepB/Spo0J family partition protein
MLTELQMLDPNSLIPSPHNPRKHDALKRIEELVESVTAKGVLQPVLARPVKGGKLQLVFGHRRREAAVRAKLESIPVMVREMTDDDAYEAAIVENADRQDVHPLDEADAFSELLSRGYTIERISERLKKKVRYVRERLELVKLHPKARAALDEEKIHIGHALLLCRIPEKLQPDALEQFVNRYEKTTLSVEAAGELVRSSYMLKLATAPFDRGDTALVPKAGACKDCPKRSGNQGELFADVKSPDVCTDPVCYRSKLDAHWSGIQKTAKASGQAIVPAKDVHFYEYSDRAHSTKWEALDGTRYTGSGSVKITTLVGKDLKPALARNPHTGTIVAMVPKSVVDKAAKSYSAKKAAKNGKDSSPAREKLSPAEKAKRAKQKLENQARELIAQKTMAAIVESCERRDASSRDFLPLLRIVVLLCEQISYASAGALLDRREGKKERRAPVAATKAVRALVEKANVGQLLGIMIELLLGENLEYPSHEETRALEEFCKTLGIDRAKVKAAAMAEAKAALEAEKVEEKVAAEAAKPKAGKKSKASKKRGRS